MSHKVIRISLNILIAIAVFLFSLSASFIFSYLLLQFDVTSSEITNTMVMLFVSGVVISLSISLKTMFYKNLQLLPAYIQTAKYIGMLIALMMIFRYFKHTL